MTWLLDLIFGGSVDRATGAYLTRLASAPDEASRRSACALISNLNNAEHKLKLKLGNTSWGEGISVPVERLLKAHGLITGGTGSGKTTFALLIIDGLIRSLFKSSPFGFGLVDPKGDLFSGTLFLLSEYLEELRLDDPRKAKDLRRRIVIFDFGSQDPVASYNILARWPGAEPDFFASNRAELLLDLLESSDGVSLAAAAVLQKLFLLLSEFNLPITYVEEMLSDPGVLNQILGKSKSRSAAAYFARQFPATPKPTLLALRRRIDALFASEGVRLALSGTTAPDFRRLQDESKIVLVNCFGQSISRGVRRVLQSLVLSDIRQAVFARQRREDPYLWFCDEAQNFFVTDKLRDSMADLLTMSRSFGTHCLFLTQNMTTAVQDARVLKTLYTNLRWSFSMRGEPSDCAFLKPVLPVTGRRLRPSVSPFEEKTFHTPTEERAILLDEIANLPDRVGYLWLRSHSSEALRMTTGDLVLPQGRDLENAIAAIRRDAAIGCRMPRKVYERMIADRDRDWIDQPADEGPAHLAPRLTEAYQRLRGSGGLNE